MNVNKKFAEIEKIMNMPVKPDLYKGKSDKHITFTYTDERPSLYADDDEIADIVYLQVSLNTKASYDYMNDKHKLKKALKDVGFIVESCQSYLESDDIRRTIFSVNYTEGI